MDLDPKNIPKKKLGLVGRNLFSALLLDQLKDYSHLELHSFYSEKEKSYSHPRLLFWPNSLVESYGGQSLREESLLIFFDDSRRLPLSDYLRRCREKTKLPEALVQKIEALLLWNDRSPYVAGPQGEPLFNWVGEKSWSLQKKMAASPQLIDLERSLPLIFSEDHFPQTHFHEASVTHLQNMDSGAASLVLEAPFSRMEMDRVLWMSYGNALNIEGRPPALPFPRPAFVWKSFGAYVDRTLLAALPSFSFWVDTDNSPEFFYTGLYRWGLFKRVYVDRNSHSPKDPSKVWLQVDELQQAETPSINRPDRFLWKLCPYLKDTSIKFSEWVAPENNFFIHPAPHNERVEGHVYQSFPGFFLNSVEDWLSQWKLKAPPKKVVAVSTASPPPA